MVDIGSYGSNSDAGIFRNSALRRKLQNQTLRIPEDRPLVNTDNEELCPHVIVGDEAFPLMPNLMRPFPGNDLDYAKRIFNYRPSRARRIAENGFGILANRWRIFHQKIPLAPENVDSVIKATVVLHNILSLENGVEARNQDSESGLIHEDLHDGILRPLRREEHRPRQVRYKSWKCLNLILYHHEEQWNGKRMLALDKLIKNMYCARLIYDRCLTCMQKFR